MAKDQTTTTAEGDAQRVALLRLVEARRAREEAEAAWREAIAEAVAAGASVRRVGEAAGVSPGRVSQIMHK